MDIDDRLTETVGASEGGASTLRPKSNDIRPRMQGSAGTCQRTGSFVRLVYNRVRPYVLASVGIVMPRWSNRT
ncbi:MAG: hypothetical protein JWO59_2380 [Chloroflexi bacterium]|nr:hypothetical protein [Chloroflexota bacterium]